MLRNRSDRRFALGLAAAIVASIGCGEAGDDTETVQSAVTTENSLAANSLAANSLAANSLAANSLAANSLAANSLAANALMVSALRDPLARELLKYVVSCALDKDDDVSIRIDGHRYDFPGELGLAPQWGGAHGSCDRSCQRWVTACVLARVDAAGVKRTISLRGDNPALEPVKRELRQFTDREATYYGNLFVRDRPLYACLSPDKSEDPRVCGDSLADCPMTVVGSCDDACADEGPYGDYVGCSDRGRAGRGTVYQESITVFLPKQQ
jgi:hypothetical protein